MNQAAVRATQALRSSVPCRQASSGLKHQLTELGPELLKRPPPKMPKGYDRIIKKREIFQADNGLPTYIKGGLADELLFRFTCLGVIGGNIYMLTLIPDLIK